MHIDSRNTGQQFTYSPLERRHTETCFGEATLGVKFFSFGQQPEIRMSVLCACQEMPQVTSSARQNSHFLHCGIQLLVPL